MFYVLVERIVNISPLVLPVAIVIKFVIDLYRFFVMKDKFRNLTLDFIGVIVIFVVIYVGGNVLFDYVEADLPIIRRFINNKIPLNEYVCPSEKIEELSKKIKEEYGINVYVDVDVVKVNGDVWGYSFTYGSKEEDVLSTLNELYAALEKYNEFALKAMPKNFYIVNEISDASGINFSYGYLLHENDFIVLCAGVPRRSIDHEIMHSLAKYMSIMDEIKMHNDHKDKCLLVSDYSCEDTSEFLCETWALSFDIDNDNEYFDLMRKEYPRFLKESSKPYSSFIDEADTGELYEGLSDNEKNVYAALYSLKEGSSYKMKANNNEIRNALRAFKSEHPERIEINDACVYGTGEEGTVSLSHNLLYDYGEARTALLEKVDEHIKKYEGYSDYDKLLGIYIDLNNSNSDDENIEEGIYKDYLQKKPELLNIYLKRLGYPFIIRTVKTIEDGSKHQAVNVKINEKYYWLDISLEYKNKLDAYFFLVSDDMILMERYTSDGPACDDSSLSYAVKKHLFLDEFDHNRIDAYVIRQMKKPADKRSIFIQCSSKELAWEVLNYLLKEENGYKRFCRLWYDNISNSCPGYSYYALKDMNCNVVNIFDFYH